MELLKFKNLSPLDFIAHGVSTRAGGRSTDAFASLNLSFKVNDFTANVFLNRAVVAEELKIETGKLFFPDQCHSTEIKVVDNKTQTTDLQNTDALICAEYGIGIGVLAADCVPVLFCDSKNRIIAAAHAGWRGTAGLIVSKVVEKMISDFGSRTADILVGIGPAISQANYEVGSEVANEILKIDQKTARFLKPSGQPGKAFLDLHGLNRFLLELAGVPGINIETMELCTYANPQLFFSARRDGFNCGRFGSVIRLL